MAQSTEWKFMVDELRKSVVPKLRLAGFSGTFPHFRRKREGKADLLSFLSHSQQGGGFEVGATVIFLDAPNAQDTNLFFSSRQKPISKLIWADGAIRHSLPGIYEGVFYYVDVYKRSFMMDAATGKETKTYYTAVTPKNEKNLLGGLLANGFECVQKADEAIYHQVAAIVADQFAQFLSWFDKIETMEDLRRFAQDEYKI